MKTISKLSLLAIALTLASCNEKVAPELQTSGSTSTPDDTPIPPDEYYFAISNSSDTRLGYKLHKTGLGNVTSKCEVRNTTGFSNDAFRANPTANDITCYFDAEELSLRAGGFNFKILASKNSCDFIGYSPYGYYNKIPGDSSGSYLQFACEGEADSADVATMAATVTPALNINTAEGAMGCGEMASTVINPASRLKVNITTDDELCRFNYKDGEAEQCDSGVITIAKYTVKYTAPEAPPDPGPSIVYDGTRTIRCGGKSSNCVKGPTKAIDASTTKVTEITQTTVNSDFELEYKNPSILGKGLSNLHYANYRRNLANQNIDFISTNDASYASFWSDPIFGKSFDPRVMDFYAANYMLDGTTRLITLANNNAERIRNNMFTARPLAADPIMGIGSLINAPNQVNPFYTFYCFDTAYDMKARIRMVVRDWDRIFPTNSDLEYLSDLFRGANARQDNPDDVEIPGDIDQYNGFNDIADWDDFIPMERTAGNFDPFSTIWRPVPDVSYPAGWYSPLLFPHFEEEAN